MEITKKEIQQIGKKFKIPENDLISFLEDEERLSRIIVFQESFRKEKNKQKRKIIVEGWLAECKNFSEFEDAYVVLDFKQLSQDFFLLWFKSCTGYAEKRTVYQCLPSNNDELKLQLIRSWIQNSNEIEDVRVAISNVSKDSAEYKLGIKKITEIYKK